jgi:hypothetical protein
MASGQGTVTHAASDPNNAGDLPDGCPWRDDRYLPGSQLPAAPPESRGDLAADRRAPRPAGEAKPITRIRPPTSPFYGRPGCSPVHGHRAGPFVRPACQVEGPGGAGPTHKAASRLVPSAGRGSPVEPVGDPHRPSRAPPTAGARCPGAGSSGHPPAGGASPPRPSPAGSAAAPAPGGYSAAHPATVDAAPRASATCGPRVRRPTAASGANEQQTVAT